MAEPDELENTVARPSQGPTGATSGPLSAQPPLEAPDRYDPTISELGRGGIGRVLSQRDLHLGREVAVKELLPELANAPGTVAAEVAQRFLNEARVTATLEHPGVVPVYELGRRADGSLYYAMKRVRGRSLDAALEGCATLSDRLALLPHLLDVVQTVAYAHSRGVIHRDLKPANVMVGAFGETQLLDWGLARVRGSSQPDWLRAPGEAAALPASTTQTLHGQVMGTPGFMSPEQARGDTPAVDERSDVWALGVMLFQLLTGRMPFEAADAHAMLEAVKSASVPDVREYEPAAPRALAEVVQRALQRDPAQRYPSAVELADSLALALGTPLSARPPLKLLAGALALGAATVLLFGLWLSARSSGDETAARAHREHLAAEQARATPLAALARQALERRDFSAAEDLATQSLHFAADPVAAGVLAVARSTPHLTRRWSTHTQAGCTSVALHDGVVACATFGGVALLDGDTGEEKGLLSTGPTGWQHAVVFLGAESVLLSGGDDRAVHVWDARDQSQLAVWPGHAAAIRTLAVSATGARLASGGLDGEVRVWDRATGNSKQLVQLKHAARALAFSAEGRLAVSSLDGVRVYDVDGKADPVVTLDRPAGALLMLPEAKGVLAAVERAAFRIDSPSPLRLSGPLDELTALARTTEGALLGADAHGEVWAWSAEGALLGRTAGFEPGVQALAFDEGLVAVATRDKRVESWQWERAVAMPDVGDPTAWLHDGRLVLGQREGFVWRSETGRPGFEKLALQHTGPVRALASGAGQLLSGGDDGRLMLVQLQSGAWRELAAVKGARVLAVALSADGKVAAWSADDGTRTVYSLAFGKEISTQKDAIARALAMTADGSRLAVGRDDKRLTLVDGATGKELATLEGFDAPVSAVQFSPDGTWLAAGSVDRKVRLVDVLTQKVVRTLAGARDRVGALEFSPDGKTLAGGADDGDVTVWNAESGAVLMQLPLAAGDVTLLHFAGPASLIVAGTDRSVRTIALDARPR